MYIEEKKVRTIPFLNAIINQYHKEAISYTSHDFYLTHTKSLGSIMARGFIEYKQVNPNELLKLDLLDFIIEFDKFLHSFNSYGDIETFFNEQSTELKTVFEESPMYINKNIPEDIQWTIPNDERLVTSSISELKKIFNYCSSLINNGRGFEIKAHCFIQAPY